MKSHAGWDTFQLLSIMQPRVNSTNEEVKVAIVKPLLGLTIYRRHLVTVHTP
jgi:hypothetical protein